MPLKHKLPNYKFRQTVANGHKQVKTIANSCKRLQTVANGRK